MTAKWMTTWGPGEEAGTGSLGDVWAEIQSALA